MWPLPSPTTWLAMNREAECRILRTQISTQMGVKLKLVSITFEPGRNTNAPYRCECDGFEWYLAKRPDGETDWTPVDYKPKG